MGLQYGRPVVSLTCKPTCSKVFKSLLPHFGSLQPIYLIQSCEFVNFAYPKGPIFHTMRQALRAEFLTALQIVSGTTPLTKSVPAHHYHTLELLSTNCRRPLIISMYRNCQILIYMPITCKC